MMTDQEKIKMLEYEVKMLEETIIETFKYHTKVTNHLKDAVSGIGVGLVAVICWAIALTITVLLG